MSINRKIFIAFETEMPPELELRVIIPREEQGIKEFDDKEFLTRKTDKENKELNSIKNDIVGLDFSFWKEKNGKI